MPDVRLSVGSMRCRHCVREVTGWLRDVPGVETIAADAKAGTVVVSGTMTEGDILAAFVGSKYAPQVLHNAATTPTT